MIRCMNENIYVWYILQKDREGCRVGSCGLSFSYMGFEVFEDVVNVQLMGYMSRR